MSNPKIESCLGCLCVILLFLFLYSAMPELLCLLDAWEHLGYSNVVYRECVDRWHGINEFRDRLRGL